MKNKFKNKWNNLSSWYKNIWIGVKSYVSKENIQKKRDPIMKKILSVFFMLIPLYEITVNTNEYEKTYNCQEKRPEL